MSASPRTVQVTLGMRHVAAALLAAAVAIGLAVVVAFGPLTASGPRILPVPQAAPVGVERAPGSGVSTEPRPGEFLLGPGNLQPPGLVVPVTPTTIGTDDGPGTGGSDTGGSRASGGTYHGLSPQ